MRTLIISYDLAQPHRNKHVLAQQIMALGQSWARPLEQTWYVRTEAREEDKVFKPGMVTMAEPNPITADGMFGIFLGHTFIVTETGHECVDDVPLEIAVA